MKVVVLGSGVVGTCSAWWLLQHGHEVVVIDREAGPAQETSFANGGQISVSYAEPWANPQAPLKLLKWMGKADAPLLFRPQFDWRQWIWGLAFLRECLPSRLAPNIQAMVRLAQYSHETLAQMRDELDLQYNQQLRGILNFYRDRDEFEGSQKAADVMRDYGVDRRIVTADEVVAIEPALERHRASILGGDYTETDESGDAHQFTVELAKRAQNAGAQFQYSTRITRMVMGHGRAMAAEVIRSDGSYDQVQGDAFVVTLGPFTPQLMRPLGIHCLIYPTKGYSATFPIRDLDAAPKVSLTDSKHKVVFSRLGDELRMAGTAELSGYSRTLNPVRCQAMTDLARELFDGMLDFDSVKYWSGLRPSTPSNVPLIGRTRVPNMYLNTGHSTLGWTMGPGSGKAIADVVSGKTPSPEFPFMGI
jgi:D-amino-acid dehydrogenase